MGRVKEATIVQEESSPQSSSVEEEFEERVDESSSSMAEQPHKRLDYSKIKKAYSSKGGRNDKQEMFFEEFGREIQG